MSLRRKAAATAVFGYVQFAVAIATGIFLIPLTLHSLGARTWGVWLASGEVLAYAGMSDLGMLGVIQWLIAEAHGRNDRDEVAELVSQAIWLGFVVAGIYAAVTLLLWHVLPSLLFLSAEDRLTVQGPLMLTVGLIAAAYPLGAYRALLTGTQDVAFLGYVQLGYAVVSAALTAVLLLKGFGLYALVLSSSAPQLAVAVILAVRATKLAPDAVFRLSRPRVHRLRFLFSNGIGEWLGNIGWQALAASNGIVVTYLGHPEWVAVYACTSKVATMALPLGWVLPDSGHVGLAQLHGEGRSRGRVREVIRLIQRLHLAIAGVFMCGLLAFNPAFVTRWVGAPMFGGLALNALLAGGVLLQSVAHGLSTSASITGHRPRVGALVLLNGAVQTPLAIFLGHRFGLPGVAAAALAAAAITSLPGCVLLMRGSGDVSLPMLTGDAGRWGARALPLLACAAAVGFFYVPLGLWLTAAGAGIICLTYVWSLRSFYAEGLPLDDRWTAWLRRVHLLPAPEYVAAPAGVAVLDEIEAGR